MDALKEYHGKDGKEEIKNMSKDFTKKVFRQVFGKREFLLKIETLKDCRHESIGYGRWITHAGTYQWTLKNIEGDKVAHGKGFGKTNIIKEAKEIAHKLNGKIVQTEP